MPGGTLTISTRTDKALINITDKIEAICKNQASSGIMYLFNPHTTAGLTINEGADPDVCRDIIAGLKNIVPSDLNFRHMEGNSPSHIMALLTGNSLTVHVENGSPLLGTWQKIFFCEFDGPRSRTVHWKFLSDTV